jgi:hypothetical protein
MPIARRLVGGEQLDEPRDRRAPHVVIRPKIYAGAALARRTRDPDATCAGLLDPDGTRAHATTATTGSNCTSGRDGRGEAGEAARFAGVAYAAEQLRETPAGEPRVVVRREIDDGTARARRTREYGRARARLLDPDDTCAHGTPATNGAKLP